MEACENASIIKIDWGLRELKVVHSAREGCGGDSDSAGTATGQHSEVQSSVQRPQDQVQELQGHLGPELQPGLHALIHGLRAHED